MDNSHLMLLAQQNLYTPVEPSTIEYSKHPRFGKQRYNMVWIEISRIGSNYAMMDSAFREPLEGFWVFVTSLVRRVETFVSVPGSGEYEGITVDELFKVHAIYVLFEKITKSATIDPEDLFYVDNYVFEMRDLDVNTDPEKFRQMVNGYFIPW